MTQKTVDEIKFLSDEAWQIKDLWKPIFQEAYELAMPTRNPYEGNKKQPRSLARAYDSTAVDVVFRGANRLMMELTPPDQKWHDVKPGPLLKMNYEKAALDQLDRELSKVVDVQSMIFQSGNFIDAMGEVYIDAYVTGHGFLLTLENTKNPVNPVAFQAVSQSEVAVLEGPFGEDDFFSRKRKIKVRMIDRLWDDASVPEEIRAMKSDAKDPEIEVLEVVYNASSEEDVSWRYEVLWLSGDKPVRMVERNYTSNPWTVFRWSKVAGSPYGPGPVLLALADIRTANTTKEMILTNAALALAGMYLVKDDGTVNPDNIIITEGGMIPVASTGGNIGASIVPLESGRGFDVGQIVLEDLRDQIRKIMMDNTLPPMTGAVRSATEIIERVRQMVQDYGGAAGRLSTGLVNLVQRVQDILRKLGFVPALKIDQFNLKVQINSPMARSQQLQEVENVVRWIELSRAVGGEEMLFMGAKLEQIIPWFSDQMGVPADLVRSDTERDVLQKNVAQLVAAQQMQQAEGGLTQQAA